MNKILPLVIFVFASICGTAQVSPQSPNGETMHVTIVKPREAKVDSFPALFSVVEKINPDTAVFTYADAMPEFPGGSDSLKIFLWGNIQYPSSPDAQGTVYVAFIVEKNGSITNVKALKEIPGAPAFTKEALRVISVMPEWTPGKMNEKPVRVKIVQPIRFGLQ